MAIAVRIIPPPRAGVNAIIRRGKLLLRLRITSLGGTTIHRERRTEFGRERRKRLIASRHRMELNVGKQFAEMHILGVPTTRWGTPQRL
jgi:hypothetical protein